MIIITITTAILIYVLLSVGSEFFLIIIKKAAFICTVTKCMLEVKKINKIFFFYINSCLHNIYVCIVYIYYVYINTHVYI